MAPYTNIIPIQCGVWKRDAYVMVVDPLAASWSFQFKETGKDEGIPAISMDKLIQTYVSENQKVMVKMDIEGAEKDIFLNHCDWLHKVHFLQIEIHDCWKIIFDRLASMDYTAFISGENVIIRFVHSHH